MKRVSLPRSHSKTLFRKTAGHNRVHAKNHSSAPMRGGIRL